jgi:hypothetical protein
VADESLTGNGDSGPGEVFDLSAHRSKLRTKPKLKK